MKGLLLEAGNCNRLSAVVSIATVTGAPQKGWTPPDNDQRVLRRD